MDSILECICGAGSFSIPESRVKVSSGRKCQMPCELFCRGKKPSCSATNKSSTVYPQSSVLKNSRGTTSYTVFCIKSQTMSRTPCWLILSDSVNAFTSDLMLDPIMVDSAPPLQPVRAPSPGQFLHFAHCLGQRSSVRFWYREINNWKERNAMFEDTNAVVAKVRRCEIAVSPSPSSLPQNHCTQRKYDQWIVVLFVLPLKLYQR